MTYGWYYKMILNQLKVLVVFLNIAFLGSFVQAQEGSPVVGVSPQEYGTLYVIEHRDQKPELWKAGLGLNYEFGNPYSSVYGLTQTIERSVHRFFWLGFQVTEFKSYNTQLLSVLQEELKGKDYSLRTEVPQVSVSALATAVPFSGHLSFFGNQPLEAQLGIRLGSGAIWYQGQGSRWLLSWSIRPLVYITRSVSVEGGFGQGIESLFDSKDRVARYRGELSVGYHF